MFFWLERFCRSPWSDDDAANTVQVAIGLPPVQKAVLALLPSLAPSHLPHLWPELIYTVVRFLRPRQVLEAWRQQQLARQQQAAAAAAAAAALQQQQAVAQQNAGAAPRPPPPPQPAALPAHVQQQHGAPAPAAGAAQQPAASGASGQEGVPSAGSSFRGMPTAAQQQQKQQYALSSAFLEKVGEETWGRCVACMSECGCALCSNDASAGPWVYRGLWHGHSDPEPAEAHLCPP